VPRWGGDLIILGRGTQAGCSFSPTVGYGEKLRPSNDAVRRSFLEKVGILVSPGGASYPFLVQIELLEATEGEGFQLLAADAI
jgi:hypothetical protein